MNRPLLLLASLTAISISDVGEAQIFYTSSRAGRGVWLLDVAGQMGQPVGDFSANVNRAWGAVATARYHFGWFSPLGLRADVGLLNYGNERKRVPLSATLNRVLVDMHTSNNIALLTGGPELMLMRGPVRPYVYAFGGYSHFYTQSSANDENSEYAIASSVNFSDGGWTTGWGGGVRIPFTARRVSAAFDAGARMTRNGTRSYLRPGDIIDQPDGSLRFTERRTTADLLQYHVGVSFAPGRWR